VIEYIHATSGLPVVRCPWSIVRCGEPAARSISQVAGCSSFL